jgi:hypothetical protein
MERHGQASHIGQSLADIPSRLFMRQSLLRRDSSDNAPWRHDEAFPERIRGYRQVAMEGALSYVSSNMFALNAKLRG